MADVRSRRAKLNIVISLCCQFVTLICGLLIPRAMIGAFGSEIYGATNSIAQFLSYIALLEGGIGGVARAALYKPLADNDTLRISKILTEIRRFFNIVGLAFVFYTVVIACSYKYIASAEFEWVFTFVLVLVISISTFAQYFIGISYSVLLQAAQQTYITNIISIGAVVVNTIITLLLISMDSNIVVVKLVSSIIFVLKPVVLWLYVRRKYKLMKVETDGETLLTQKMTGLGQHLAFFLHNHTDVAVLTIFSNLKFVAVYSVYYMITSQIQNITSSFGSGMEAVFGDMLARNEKDELDKSFDRYELLISFVAVVLFSVTLVMIIPFVKIYTSGINDANYIQKTFSIFLIIAALIYCLRIPYHGLVVAAGHFKQTKFSAYGEAMLNIVLSVVFVFIWGLTGVALATAVSTLFRLIYYVVYISKKLINRSVLKFLKREVINVFSLLLVCALGGIIKGAFEISNYFVWIIVSAIVTMCAIIITTVVNFIFYKNDFAQMLYKIKSKLSKKDR